MLTEAPSELEAATIVGYLESNGIRAAVQGQDSPYQGLPLAAVQILVRSEDLERARKLIARSGTRGARVQVWAPADHAAVAIYFAGLLRRLGYQASAHIVTGHTSRYYYAVGDPKRRAQAGWSGWIRDYTSAADFIRPLFTCSGIAAGDPAATTNYSRLCEVGVDRRVRTAEHLQQSDPVAGQEAWGAADRAIVDRAAAVPFANDLALTFLSQRTGNYQSNPEWGVLLDQLWVR